MAAEYRRGGGSDDDEGGGDETGPQVEIRIIDVAFIAQIVLIYIIVIGL